MNDGQKLFVLKSQKDCDPEQTHLILSACNLTLLIIESYFEFCISGDHCPFWTVTWHPPISLFTPISYQLALSAGCSGSKTPLGQK
jgi:hypothetical protein